MTAVGSVVITPVGGGRPHRIGPDRFWLKDGVDPGSDGFSVIEYEGSPGVPGPPPHLHRAFDEAWFVLEGEVRFRSPRPSTVLGRGAYAFVPRGTPHTFEVVGDRPARWIGVFAPARYVALLEELGVLLAAVGPPDPESIRTLFGRYETELAETVP